MASRYVFFRFGGGRGGLEGAANLVILLGRDRGGGQQNNVDFAGEGAAK